MRPELDLVQDSAARSFQTTVAVAVSILGLLRIAEVVEDSRFSYQRELFQRALIEITETEDVLTLVLPGEVRSLVQP